MRGIEAIESVGGIVRFVGCNGARCRGFSVSPPSSACRHLRGPWDDEGMSVVSRKREERPTLGIYVGNIDVHVGQP